MEPITTHAWEQRALKEALARFAKHQIVSSSPGRWYVRAPDSRNLAYEVTVQSGRVLVDGDVDPIGFAGGSGWDSPEEYVAWIGRHTDVDYAAGKAGQWWGDSKPMHERVAEVMLFDLAQMIARLDEEIAQIDDEEESDGFRAAREAATRIDNGDDVDEVLDPRGPDFDVLNRLWDESLRTRALLREAIAKVDDGGSHDALEELVRWLYEELPSPDSEVLSGLGEVVSRRVIVGVAALAHLHALLQAKAAAATATEGTETR